MTRQRGQALVEAALVFVGFFVLIVGLVGAGQMLFLHQTLVDRAHAAVRWGATQHYDPAAIANLVLYGKTSHAPDERPFAGLNESNVIVSQPDCEPSPNLDCRVTVVISGYRYQMFGTAMVYQARPIQVSLPSELPNATQ